MIQLKNNGVSFDEALHEYWMDGKPLQGITRAISKYIHPNKYDAVSNDVLMAAADRGHAIHSAIEIYCSLGMKSDSIAELEDFIRIKEQYGIETVANEYIVTDNEYYASPIDYVCKTPDCEENEVNIIDFKSTSSIDEMRLAVQLTIYKMFFESNNPGLKVKRVGVIWLPREEYGGPMLKWTDTVDEELAQKLLDAYRNDQEFHSELITKEYSLPERISNMETRIGGCITIGKAIDTYLKQLKADLLEEMEKNDVKSYVGEHLKISISKGYLKNGGYDTNGLLGIINELIDGYDDEGKAEILTKVENCKKSDVVIGSSLKMSYN